MAALLLTRWCLVLDSGQLSRPLHLRRRPARPEPTRGSPAAHVGAARPSGLEMALRGDARGRGACGLRVRRGEEEEAGRCVPPGLGGRRVRVRAARLRRE